MYISFNVTTLVNNFHLLHKMDLKISCVYIGEIIKEKENNVPFIEIN